MIGKGKKTASISTFIEYGVVIEGTIHFQDTIRIDGKLKGKITAEGGTVIVGEKGVMDAQIMADVVIIMGEVNGTIVAKERLEIYPPGRVLGDIQAPVVSIEAGVVFNGNCSMKTIGTVGDETGETSKKLTNGEPNKGKKIF
jgi:cytoskeletal protein CcmA (bactofilin family)